MNKDNETRNEGVDNDQELDKDEQIITSKTELIAFIIIIVLAVVFTPLGLLLWLSMGFEAGVYVFLLGLGCLICVPIVLRQLIRGRKRNK